VKPAPDADDYAGLPAVPEQPVRARDDFKASTDANDDPEDRDKCEEFTE
jgi:hypothetical protein